ncbi:MAG: 4Fe-4S binding protein [Candidatus Zixiibacteriota bacterium]|nr:MAG: 4Fe-4S binding protein [candidate division Zixibacteria bacterium]
MQAGLLKTFTNPVQSRRATAWLLSAALFVVYFMFYFNIPPGMEGLAAALGLDSRWTLYGILYTIAIIVGGGFFLKRHGNSRYHRVRTISLMFFQIVFAFSIPMVMELFGSKGFTFSIFWPLKIDYFYPSNIFEYPVLLIVYAFVTALIGVPIMTILFGKRWYCSWMCGCGGLAETAGEPFRHLTSKSSGAWRFEQAAIHSVLVLAIVTTALVLINWGLHHTNGQGEWVASYAGFDAVASKVQGVYQFIVVAMLSGVLGVGLYPLMGNRVWCRYFCPLAAILGLFQKFGRFRITVKDDMCISCGNCSTYCEMGIDVRAYAQTNVSFKRAACVGCGICAHVCPRGVLKLENKWDFRQGPDQKVIKIFDM